MSPSAHESYGDSEQGFSLLEVTFAIVILTVALLSAALLTTRILGGGQQSRYMSLAATLASEKLEDLNRWDPDDPSICVPTGSTTAGSLTSDVLQTTTCPGGASASVNYYDDVNISLTGNGSGANCPGSTSGCLAETVSSVSGGSTVFTTTYHTPDGQINTNTSSTAPTSTTFHRRWIIEANQPVTGTRRVTVLVTLTDLSVQPPVNFQMSAVRP